MKIFISKVLIFQYAAIITVNLTMLTTGMSISWPSPMLIKLRNQTQTPLTRIINTEEGSWIVSLGYLGSIITNIFIGGLMNTIGRKKCVLLLSLPRLAMAIFCTLATNVWMIILARTVTTMIDCMYFVMVPVYASEIAGKKQRGVLGTFMQILTCLGAVITLSIGPFLSYTNFNIIFTSIVAVTSIIIVFLPESPYFLYSEGHTLEAYKVLYATRPAKEAEEEIEEFKAIANTSKEKINIISLLSDKTRIKSLLLGILTAVAIQIIGYNVVTFYLQTILELTKTEIRSEIASVIISIMEFCAGCCTMIITNKFARKTVLAWSLSGYVIGMMGLGTFFTLRDFSGYLVAGFLNYLPIISLIIVIFSYSAGIGNLVWLILGEIFDGPGRAFGVAISLILCNITIFLTTKYFYLMTEVLGPAGTFWFYGVMAIILNILLNIFLPETKDKSFNEIQRALGRNTEIKNEVY